MEGKEDLPRGGNYNCLLPPRGGGVHGGGDCGAGEDGEGGHLQWRGGGGGGGTSNDEGQVDGVDAAASHGRSLQDDDYEFDEYAEGLDGFVRSRATGKVVGRIYESHIEGAQYDGVLYAACHEWSAPVRIILMVIPMEMAPMMIRWMIQLAM